ncbi:L-threonine O-3-phosphate decarboxylase [Faunimonas pinastri]|uniref:Aminotransferase n=1 Tax=Faunimonas pinastri TaxID=1855383 RepID=A0A1H9DER6_9HYPH|nr:aminotransferase class I/II-fold pyridoxal phosphate-dependent enzyme [Faunimonas pinastri]SEQ11797.1 L-threonine O-3-phosphate decarboxylase [Faunimonas pinastri]
MRHGGDLGPATEIYGIREDDWLDLSTGINPRPWTIRLSVEELAATLTRLPSAAEQARLLASARQAYGVPDGIAIAAASGTETLIRRIAALAPRAVAAETSYRTYAETFRIAGQSLPFAPSLSLGELPRTHSLLIVNPNNPDGRCAAADRLLDLARKRTDHAILVIDEAYADSEINCSVIPDLRPDDPVLVFRSFGKFYGLPGLRLGFAIGRPDLVARLSDEIGDWPVSGPAIAIATPALLDKSWRQQTRHWLGNQAQALDSILYGAGLSLVGGCRMFRLASSNEARRVHEGLAHQGIWTRVFDERPDVIRLGLPPDDAGLQRLAKALARL